MMKTKQKSKTPAVAIYQEYERSKRGIAKSLGYGDQYDKAIRKLAAELGV